MLQQEKHKGVVTLTLNRPDKGNALSAALVEAMIEQITGATDDADIHTLVISAAGKHFCTGFDLSDVALSSEGDLLQRFVRIEQLLQLLWSAPVRTIAVAQGRTWGAGADIFAACEMRLCAPGTTFRFPGARFGIVLGTRRLGGRVGHDAARRWLLDGLDVNTETAQTAGLATEVTADPRTRIDSLAAQAVARETGTVIRALTRSDAADRDLAELVRSCARPGLKARIEAYIAQGRRPAGNAAVG